MKFIPLYFYSLIILVPITRQYNIQNQFSFDSLKECILINGLKDSNFINCYGKNFTKLKAKLQAEL